MRYVLILALLCSGCAALTPGAVKDSVATMNRDMAKMKQVIAAITTNEKILATVDLIAANASATDALLK